MLKRLHLKKYLSFFLHTNFGTLTVNMLSAYIAFALCRIVFFFMNYSTFAPYLDWSSAMTICQGAFVFDSSALLYLNSMYIILLLFPFHLKERKPFHTLLKCIFVLANAVGVASNLIDSVYFQYTGRRTTFSVFDEFANESNIAGIILGEALRYWYLLIIFAFMVFALCKLYRKPRLDRQVQKAKYYFGQTLSIVVLLPFFILGVRGSLSSGTRPITISNANSYINHAVEAGLVLNTPFSIIRTISHRSYETPDYMGNEQMEKTYTPIIYPQEGNKFQPKNIVILIMESFGKEYSNFFNPSYSEEGNASLTPFLDSIASQSLCFKYSYANGRKSQDAMPSILASIPMFIEPFVLTDASLNDIGGLAHELKSKNYYCTFFHGGENISMGFSAFAKQAGFDAYFGFNEYSKDKKYGGRKDWDGKWAVWDEEFLQFFCDNIDSFPQPFLTSAFTATSHSPFNIPKRYEADFPEGKYPMYKCIRYSDMALQRFFEKASKSRWFNNTIFVIVADHTSGSSSSHAEYQTDLGVFSIPIIFYTPDKSLKAEVREDLIMQQIDIMPTLLGMLQYDKPYVAFGCDVLHTPAEQTFMVNYNNGIYQYAKGDLFIQFDGNELKAVYRYKQDSLLEYNLKGKTDAEQELLQQLKAIVQQYMQRMNTNNLLLKTH